MPESSEHQVTIEKTPSYFVTKETPERIKKMNNKTKIIIVVRDPVTRAISDYAQAKSKRPNLLSFDEMIHLGSWAIGRKKQEMKRNNEREDGALKFHTRNSFNDHISFNKTYSKNKKYKKLKEPKIITSNNFNSYISIFPRFHKNKGSDKNHSINRSSSYSTKIDYKITTFPANNTTDYSKQSVSEGWGPIKIGLYARHLSRWLKSFPLQQIHFVHGEKLILDPSGELALLQNFLNLPHYIGDHFFVHDPVKGFPCLRLPASYFEEDEMNNTRVSCVWSGDCRSGYDNGQHVSDYSGDDGGGNSRERSWKMNKINNTILNDGILTAESSFLDRFNNESRLKTLSKYELFNQGKQFKDKQTELKTRCLGETKGRKHPRVKAETVEKLRAFYRPHNQLFYQLSKINFGWP